MVEASIKNLNTNKKALAKTKSGKDLPKRMKCSFYGKTMENVRNRVKIELTK